MDLDTYLNDSMGHPADLYLNCRLRKHILFQRGRESDQLQGKHRRFFYLSEHFKTLAC